MNVILQEKVLDLKLLEDEGDVTLKLMMVVVRDSETHFQIRSYPSYEKLYELKVNQFIYWNS